MVSGVVRAAPERQLVMSSFGEWTPGASKLDFRAAIVRNRRLYGVLVRYESKDGTRAFVRFPDGCTGWVPVADLVPG